MPIGSGGASAAATETSRSLALEFDGWYDIFINGGLNNFNGMRTHGGSRAARAGTQLVVGPWLHIPWARKVGQIDFKSQVANPIDRLQLRWFDYWLKGIQNGVNKRPRVRVFVMGTNRWRTANTWPLPHTKYVKYYFHSRGRANSVNGNGWPTTRAKASRLPATISSITRPIRCPALVADSKLEPAARMTSGRSFAGMTYSCSPPRGYGITSPSSAPSR